MRAIARLLSVVVPVLCTALGCGSDGGTTPPVDSGAPPIDSGTPPVDTGAPADVSDAGLVLTVTSTAFVEGATIPAKYTCSGTDVSPPLAFTGAAGKAKAYALLVLDPDAPGGTFTHWVLFDLPASTSSLAEGSAGAGVEGKNGFGSDGWRGPCPPPGKAHRYFFWVYALDTTLGLPAGSTRDAVEGAMAGHVIGQGSLMGTFNR